MSDFLDTAQAHPDISSVFAQDDGASMIQMLLLYAPDAFIDYDAAQAGFDSPRVYLKTPNAPGQRIFSRCAAPFFLEIRQYSCEKMSCSAQKFLAAGHIGSFQIHPKFLRLLELAMRQTQPEAESPHEAAAAGCRYSQILRKRRRP